MPRVYLSLSIQQLTTIFSITSTINKTISSIYLNSTSSLPRTSKHSFSGTAGPYRPLPPSKDHPFIHFASNIWQCIFTTKSSLLHKSKRSFSGTAGPYKPLPPSKDHPLTGLTHFTSRQYIDYAKVSFKTLYMVHIFSKNLGIHHKVRKS